MTPKNWTLFMHVPILTFLFQIGMSHDFDHDTSRNCDGIMDYNGKNHWSDCSIDDFKDWWMTIGQTCSSIQPQY